MRNFSQSGAFIVGIKYWPIENTGALVCRGIECLSTLVPGGAKSKSSELQLREGALRWRTPRPCSCIARALLPISCWLCASAPRTRAPATYMHVRRRIYTKYGPQRHIYTCGAVYTRAPAPNIYTCGAIYTYGSQRHIYTCGAVCSIYTGPSAIYTRAVRGAVYT